MVAVGGYGRQELAPGSDIDLLFLCPYKRTPHVEQVSEFLLYKLWDLGLKVGQAVRSVSETIKLAKSDLTVQTALLEARLLWGSADLFAQLRRSFEREIVAGRGAAFAEAKLAERDQRHQRMGDSRFMLEPNIKEGKGGLRDLQTLLWIARFLKPSDDPGEMVRQGLLTRQSLVRFLRSRRFLWTVRCHLHYLTGRAEDRLTFDLQPEIARRMGYRERNRVRAVERFMKRYYLVAKDVGALTRIFCAALEEQQQRPPRFSLPRFGFGRRKVNGFVVQGNRLNIGDSGLFEREPDPDARAVPLGAGARARHAPAGAGGGHAPSRADRPEGARGSGGQPAVPRHAVLAQGPGADPDPDERDRPARPFHPGLRAHRRADAAQPLPRLHGRRAHDPRDRHPLADRERPARRRAADLDRGDAQAALAARALCRGVPARHRQGPGGDHSELGEAGRQAPVPALGPARRRHRDRGLAGAPPPRHEPLRLQARQRGSADHPGLRRHRAVAGAAEAAPAADRDRHPRRRPQRLERLEGPAAARALSGGRGGHGDGRPAGPPRAPDRARQGTSSAEALAALPEAPGRRPRSRPIWPATIRATGWASPTEEHLRHA